MCVQNMKCAALPVPEIIGGTEKIWAVPGYAHASFFPKFLTGFVRMDPVMYLPNLKFVALPVPEIIRGSQKIWAAPWIRLRSLFFTRSHDVVVKFDTYRNVQRHRAVIPAIAWLSN